MEVEPVTIHNAREALKEYFGYDSFRPLQEEIIDSVLEGKDTVVLMPTGGGKSVCFQVPAIIREGFCVVVSPLIALMKDQVEALKANGVPAEFLNSSLSNEEQGQVAHLVRTGKIKLLYLSPERLLTPEMLNFLQDLPVSLFAVDEAHCISSWGHDFRPEYTKLATLKERFPEVPVIALTATADKLTRKDIANQLRLTDPLEFIASFDRPNLSLAVLPGQNRFEAIHRFIKKRPGQSGIIYTLSRKGAESLSNKLRKQGVNAGFYHAGMTPDQRSKAQEAFVNDKVPIICATIAFGMGIDKSNVRWVIHYNLPKNIEGYYQEIGRAGRDGLDSETLLFYSYADVMNLQRMLNDGESTLKEVQLTKLERMMQYANAMICRRKILLGYFGEVLDEDCGNCDVCADPPTYIDGTVIAQKALSAVYRMKEQVGTGMLIDVLRGSGRAEVRQKGYDRIKTYGAGREISLFDWQDYIKQMLNQGLLEIAYDEGNALKLTDKSKAVLFEQEKVKLAKPKPYTKKETPKKVKPAPLEVKHSGLFRQLRRLRAQIAEKEKLAPYMVFHDATLKAMANELPITPSAMGNISGVGQAKLSRFGDQFINEILSYVQDQQSQGKQITPAKAPEPPTPKPKKEKSEKVSTQELTYWMLKAGKSIEEIAQQRELKPATVYSHISKLVEEGKDLDLRKFVPKEVQERVQKTIQEIQPEGLRPIFEHLNEEVPYGQIRLVMAIWRQEQKS